MKILSVTPQTFTYEHNFSDNGKMQKKQFTVDRRFIGNSMSTEFARRHNLEKYAIK